MTTPDTPLLSSASQLARAIGIALLVAAVILVAAVLPAEYGIDPTGIGRVLGLTDMGELKQSLAEESAADKAAHTEPRVQAAAAPAAPEVKPAATPAPAAEAPAKEAATGQQHTMTVKLKPGQGAEIKLTMRKDASVRYEWSTEGGPVNYDTHGDPVNAPKNFYHGYGKGRNTASNSGTLQAAFDGTHGWFWRNRSNNEVTVTLKTSGDYQQIKRVL